MAKKFCRIAIITFGIVVVFLLAVRFTLFLVWEDTFAEWNEIVDEFDYPYYGKSVANKLNYHMESIFEVYLVKHFAFYNDSGITTEHLIAEYQPFVDQANELLDGSDVKLYVGHDAPEFLDGIPILAKPINFIYDIFDTSSNDSNDYFWHIIIYKRTRGPFRM